MSLIGIKYLFMKITYLIKIYKVANSKKKHIQIAVFMLEATKPPPVC